VKIPDLFIELYMVKGPAQHCYLEDLRWAWKVFVMETGVQAPEDWLRCLVLDHHVSLEEPAPWQSWRGWQVKGLALNAGMLQRHNRYRMERIGLCKSKQEQL
jgi:hypothetical protein